MASIINLIQRGFLPGLAQVENKPVAQLVGELTGALPPDPLYAYTKPTDFFNSGIGKTISSLIFSAVPYSNVIKQSITTVQPTDVSNYQAPQYQPTKKIGGPMAFADGTSGGLFDNFPSFGDVGSIFQGPLGRDLLGLGTQALSGFVQQQFAPTYGPFNSPGVMQATPVMAAVPAIMRGGAIVGRAFFNRFPNLAVAMQKLRNAGSNVTRANLYSALKRFGPEMLIAGGMLSAGAVAELTVAGPGRRRMNAGNIKALRKAHRRMKSFHKICRKNDVLITHARKRKS